MSSPIGVGMGRPANMFGTVGSEPARQTTQTAQAASQAPVSLTLPAPPRSDMSAGQADRVRTIASEPARAGGVAPSRADVAKGKLVAAGEKLLAARQEGVDVAKTSFWKKALGVALSGVAVGVAVGLTAISFGGATPLLALACVNFAVSTGDAICAYRNMRNTEAIADHRPPPYDSKVASYAGTAVAVASTVGGMLTDDADREQLKETLDGVRQNVTSLATPAGRHTELDAEGELVAGCPVPRFRPPYSGCANLHFSQPPQDGQRRLGIQLPIDSTMREMPLQRARRADSDSTHCEPLGSTAQVAMHDSQLGTVPTFDKKPARYTIFQAAEVVLREKPVDDSVRTGQNSPEIDNHRP